MGSINYRGPMTWDKFYSKYGDGRIRTSTVNLGGTSTKGATTKSAASSALSSPALSSKQVRRLMAAYEQANAQAKAANEARYQQILGGYNDRMSDVMTLWEKLGAQEGADIRQRWQKTANQQQQDFVRRGLVGTSVLPSMRAGVTTNMNADLARLAESLTAQRASALTGLTGDRLAFMERREDEYPDYTQMLSLLYRM